MPIKETIDIIIDNIYSNPSLPILKINPNILRKLLLICTTKVPFYNYNGDVYTQIDGISMDSVLGPTFSNFYKSNLEKKIFNDIKKHIYVRYVDNILIIANNIEEIKNYKKHSKITLSSNLLMN